MSTDIFSKKYGRLTPIKRVIHNGKQHVLCLCDCGKETFCIEYHLKNGNRISCGCYRIKNKQGYPKLYTVWKSMKRRCENELDKSYVWYGARGIKVCDEWKNYNVF